MALNDVFELVLGFKVGEEKTVNVLHYKQTSSDGANPPNQEVAAAWQAELWGFMQDCLSEDAELQTLSCKRIQPTLGGTTILDVNEPGDIAGDVLPAQSSLLVSLYSETPTANGRGRINIAGLSKTWVEEGLLLAANAPTVATFMDNQILPIGGGSQASFKPVIFSRTLSLASDITSYQIRSYLHTLRSRRATA